MTYGPISEKSARNSVQSPDFCQVRHVFVFCRCRQSKLRDDKFDLVMNYSIVVTRYGNRSFINHSFPSILSESLFCFIVSAVAAPLRPWTKLTSLCETNMQFGMVLTTPNINPHEPIPPPLMHKRNRFLIWYFAWGRVRTRLIIFEMFLFAVCMLAVGQAVDTCIVCSAEESQTVKAFSSRYG